MEEVIIKLNENNFDNLLFLFADTYFGGFRDVIDRWKQMTYAEKITDLIDYVENEFNSDDNEDADEHTVSLRTLIEFMDGYVASFYNEEYNEE